MKRFAFSKVVIATALVGACSVALAADTAEIIVKGALVPAACSIDITGGGVFDYGIMTKAQIEVINGVDAQTTQTVLDEKTATMTIDCGQTDTSVAWRILDNRANTATTDINGFNLFGIRIFGDRKHGLGTATVASNTVNIGQYAAGFDTASIRLTAGGQTNVAGQGVMSDSNGSAWQTGTNGPQLIHGSRWLLQSFRTTTSSNGLPPEPFAHATADVHVRAALNRLDALPDAFSFNGQTTLTLVYLGADHKPLP